MAAHHHLFFIKEMIIIKDTKNLLRMSALEIDP